MKAIQAPVVMVDLTLTVQPHRPCKQHNYKKNPQKTAIILNVIHNILIFLAQKLS